MNRQALRPVRDVFQHTLDDFVEIFVALGSSRSFPLWVSAVSALLWFGYVWFATSEAGGQGCRLFHSDLWF